jgi:hypothetical protein
MPDKDHTPGAFVRIPFRDGSFGYGRLLNPPFAAFYDLHSAAAVSDLNAIAARPVLFIVAIHWASLDNWQVIGNLKLEKSMQQPVVQFMQDLADYRKCQIVDSEGSSTDATPEECMGLERAAVWNALHVETRLLDTFAGRPNTSVERARVRLG